MENPDSNPANYQAIFRDNYRRICTTAYILTGDADLTKSLAHKVILELFKGLSQRSLFERADVFLDSGIVAKCLSIQPLSSESQSGTYLSEFNFRAGLSQIAHAIQGPEPDEKVRIILSDRGISSSLISDILLRRSEFRNGGTRIDPDLQSEWIQFNIQTGAFSSIQGYEQETLPKKPRTFRGPFYRLAVAIGIALIIYFLVQRLLPAALSDSVTEIKTGKEMTEFTLPDGTAVWMNSESYIAFGEKFGEAERRVQLSGEAFFEVGGESPVIFVIRTGNSEIRTRDASLNIRNFESEDRIELAVVNGSANFFIQDESMETVTGGTVFVFRKKSQDWEKKVRDPANSYGWKDGILRFNHSGIAEVFSDLENHFRISISVLNEGIYNCEFTGAFQDPDINDIMNVISRAVNIELKQSPDRNWVASGHGCL